MKPTPKIYRMDLHETALIDEGMRVHRVPGGWIYMLDMYSTETSFAITSVFVPYSSEFLPERPNHERSPEEILASE